MISACSNAATPFIREIDRLSTFCTNTVRGLRRAPVLPVTGKDGLTSRTFASMELKSKRVSFRIRDVYNLSPEAVLLDLRGNDLLSGEVIDVSDSGLKQRAFVVVKVDEIRHLLIVPVDRILEVV